MHPTWPPLSLGTQDPGNHSSSCRFYLAGILPFLSTHHPSNDLASPSLPQASLSSISRPVSYKGRDQVALAPSRGARVSEWVAAPGRNKSYPGRDIGLGHLWGETLSPHVQVPNNIMKLSMAKICNFNTDRQAGWRLSPQPQSV